MNKFLINAMQSVMAPFVNQRIRADQKHDHQFDFGYPTQEQVNFWLLYNFFERSSAAQGLVDKTVNKTWETHPQLFLDKDSDGEDGFETGFAEYARRTRLWQKIQEADRRALVGRYGGLLLRFRDDKPFHEPVDENSLNGFDDLVDVIPCWENQLRISEWDHDVKSERFGEPIQATYTQTSPHPEQGESQSLDVHYSRFIIWSRDMTTFGQPPLLSSLNALLDMVKIRGGGAEGYWLNAKRPSQIEVDPNVRIDQLKSYYGVETGAQVREKINEELAKSQENFDKKPILQGMKITTDNVPLESPQHFHAIAAQEAATGFGMPVRVWMGSETGERASTEDNRAWALTCESRRMNWTRPGLEAFFERLQFVGVIPPREEGYFIKWTPLTDDTPDQRIERAFKMEDTNAKAIGTGEVVYTRAEIRETAGFSAEPDVEEALPSATERDDVNLDEDE